MKTSLRLVSVSFCVMACAGLLATSSAFAKPKAKGKEKKATAFLVPATQVTIKNGAMLADFSSENAWMKDFAKSNLRDGLLLRLGQVLNAFPAPEQEKTWKGSLQDFVLRQAIKDKPMIVGHYIEPDLVSPFAVAFPDLGPTELSIFESLLGYFGNGSGENTSVEVVNDDGTKSEGTFVAKPIRIGTYNFAYRIAGKCLAFSRDPKLAVSMAEACKAQTTPATDLVATLDWSKLAPPLKAFLKKYAGTSTKMTVEGKFANHAFQLTRATMPWKANDHIGASNDVSSVLGVLPSETAFFTALPLVAPPDLTKESVTAYLLGQAGEEKKKSADFGALLFAAFGEKGLESGILLSRPNVTNDLQAMSELLNDKAAHPIEIKQVCGKDWVLLSPQGTLYEKLEATCKGTTPALANLRAGFVEKMKGQAQHRVFLNTPAIGEALVRLGWTSSAGAESLPPEVQETITLLRRVSQFYAAGQIEKNVMTYEITQGEL